MLQLQKLSIHGTFECQRSHLQDTSKVELQLELIIQTIDQGDKGKEVVLLLIMQAIPCIMHLENRVGEKLITVLLSLGAELFQRWQTRSLPVAASSIMRVVNTRLLGTLTRPRPDENNSQFFWEFYVYCPLSFFQEQTNQIAIRLHNL